MASKTLELEHDVRSHIRNFQRRNGFPAELSRAQIFVKEFTENGNRLFEIGVVFLPDLDDKLSQQILEEIGQHGDEVVGVAVNEVYVNF